jgi:AraC-like DNA-binding protein
MNISVTDQGSGIAFEFAKAIGAIVKGRFIHIPDSKGKGYITGFSWGNDLKMMIRNYYLKEDIFIERTNKQLNERDDIVFLLSGVLPVEEKSSMPLSPEQSNILICKHAVSSIMAMPSNTIFGSITIAVSRKYLKELFGAIDHPMVISVLQAEENFVLEIGVSSEIIKISNDFLHQPVQESLASRYYKLKCEELLCYIFSILMQRETLPTGNIHIDDIKAIYAIKSYLQSHLDTPPDISSLAKKAHMGQPKLRKLFRQIFDKGVFEYYQFMRMQEAARLLRKNQLSVSEVGYKLGFSNLSHFSRVFEQCYGMKPKKYSAMTVN